MKRHVSKTLLALAFGLLSVGSFVGCKDYDEDVYVDLKSRLSKETSLREALQIQVNELEAFVKTLKSCECDMEAYLTKLEADKTYMKKGDYADQVAQIAKNKAAIELLQKAIDGINDRLDNLDLKDDQRVDNLVQQISDMNGLISQVKATADEALRLAKEGKCECNLTPLENRVKTLEDLIAGWDEKVKDLNLKTDKALALATKDSILLVQQKKTLDSLIVVVDDLKQGLTNQIMSVVNQYMTNNNYITKNDVTEIVQNILKDYYTKTEVDNILNNLVKNDYLTKNYYTKEEVLRLINSIEIPGQVDLSNILRRLADLEGAPAVDAYSKSETYSKTEIDALINAIQIPGAYNDQWIKDTLENFYIKDSLYTKGYINALQKMLQNTDSIIKITADSALKVALANADSIMDHSSRIGTLERQMSDVLDSVASLKNRVDSIEKRVTTLEGKVKDLEDRVDVLEEFVNKVKADIQKMITGIIVQGTQSPVLGYFNAPLDTRSTVLAVYYGETTAAWEFPSTIPSNYVNGSSDFALWTPRKLNIIGGSFSGIDGYTSGSANQKLVTLNEDGQEDGNAGTIYVTVNPSNVDFTNAQLKLKDSQDGDAYATLSPLKVSDRLLTFGYTRAGNGFYEAKATITAANVENAALKVDYNELEEDAKTIWRERSKTSVLSMGASLVKMFQNMIPAYAVSSSWTDESNGTEHKIYSQYNVAATAIKPLSFAFMNDFHASSMPGIDRVYNLVDEVVNKINIKVNLGLPDFAKYKGSITFKDITLPTIGDNMFRITYNKTYTSEDLAGDGKLYGDTSDKDLYFLVTNVKDGRYALVSTAADGTTQKLYIYNPDTGAYHEATATEQAAWGAIEFGLTVDVDINKTPEIKQTLQDIIDSFNSEFGANSDVAKNITNLLNDVASLGNIDTKINTSISDAKADIKSQINSLITRANNKLTSWFNRIPSMLNLALVGGKDNQIGLLSQSKANATNASGSLKLVPTTYSLELLAPAYKKFVVVSDVFNADGTKVAEATAKSMASAANGKNMGKVITSDKTCTLNAGQSGYIYEITYTAIDYFGKVAIKHYYVRF